MANAWQRLEESLYFFLEHWPALARLLLPVVVPAVLLGNYRAWLILDGDLDRVLADPLLRVLEIILTLFVNAATITYACRVLRGSVPSFLVLRQDALAAMLGLMVVHGLVFLAVFGGLCLLIVPGLWIAGCLLPAYVYVVGERKPALESLRLSFARFRPQAWQLVLTLALTSLMLLPPLLLSLIVQELAEGLSPVVRMLLDVVMDTAIIFASLLFIVVLVRFHDWAEVEQGEGALGR